MKGHKLKPAVDEWLERTLHSYPSETARFLRTEKDPFRNPVGQALKENLPILFDELVGPMDPARLTAALDSIVRIRAVQDFRPSQALSFVFLLKPVLRRHDPQALAALEERIDKLALLAFDLYMRCREQIFEAQAKEVRRRVFVLEKAHPLERGDAR